MRDSNFVYPSFVHHKNPVPWYYSSYEGEWSFIYNDIRFYIMECQNNGEEYYLYYVMNRERRITWTKEVKFVNRKMACIEEYYVTLLKLLNESNDQSSNIFVAKWRENIKSELEEVSKLFPRATIYYLETQAVEK